MGLFQRPASRMASASGLSRCWTLVLVSVCLLGPLAAAQGQEPPPARPTAPSREGPSPGPGAPGREEPRPTEPAPPPRREPPPSLLLPGLESIGSQAPTRPSRFIPILEEVGPFRLSTFLTVEEEFTDNANQTKNNRRSEFRTSIAPAVAAWIDRPSATASLRYAPRLFFPGNRTDDATLDQNLSVRAGWSPTALIRLGISDDFTKSTDFRDVGDIGTRRTSGQAFSRNVGTADVGYSRPPFGVGLGYSNTLINNDAPGSDDSQTHTVRADGDLTNPRYSLGASYAVSRGDFTISSSYWEHVVGGRASRTITPTTSGTLNASFTQHDSEQGQDFKIYEGRLGATTSLGPDGSLSASGGVSVFDPTDGELSVRPSVSVSWTQRFPLFAVSAQYQEGFATRFQAVDNTGVTATRSAVLSLTSTAFRDVAASLIGRWTENRFEQTTTAAGPAGTRDRTWDVDANIRYAVIRWLYVYVGYALTIRTSTISTNEFLENRVRLGITGQYDFF